MIFDGLRYEKVLDAITPIVEAMEEVSSPCMKIAFSDEGDVPVATVVVARDDKAALVLQAIDLIDKAYDAGRDGNSMDGLDDLTAGLVNDAYSAGRVAKESRPDEDDDPAYD